MVASSIMADDPVTSVSNTSSDPTPYIRTYAKDVARLTGNTVGSSHSGPHKEGPEAGVLLPDFDPSQRQAARGEEASPREFPQEVFSVTKDDTVANLNTPTQETKSAQRDEILTRLRAKVGREVEQTESAPPAQAFVPVQSHPIVVPAPEPPASVVPAQAFPARLPTQPVETPAPAVETAKHEHEHVFPFFSHHGPKRQPSDPAPSNLHTFKSDFADHIDAQKASTFSVLAAQSDAREVRANAPQPVVLKTKRSRVPLVIGGIALVVFGTGIIGGAYWFVALRLPAVSAPFTVPSLIFADEKVEISGTGPALAQAIKEVAQQASVNGNIIVTYVVATDNGKTGIIHAPQPGGPVIRQIFAGAPDILLRNITDASTVGVIDAADTNAPFFILDVSSYERTFAGMLGWESSIAEDLASLYPSYGDAAQFVDAAVANHDVRALKDSSGRTILLYGYRDKHTLIIARDEAAFTAILVRMSAANAK